MSYLLDPAHTDPERLKHERQKARDLRQTAWWKNKIGQGLCHYCGKRFRPAQLTMDHIVPLARGGTSTKGNIVAACHACNKKKKLGTPVEELIDGLNHPGEK
jgi:5-methylcytosine-specific restriction enzyme A